MGTCRAIVRLQRLVSPQCRIPSTFDPAFYMCTMVHCAERPGWAVPFGKVTKPHGDELTVMARGTARRTTGVMLIALTLSPTQLNSIIARLPLYPITHVSVSPSSARCLSCQASPTKRITGLRDEYADLVPRLVLSVIDAVSVPPLACHPCALTVLDWLRSLTSPIQQALTNYIVSVTALCLIVFVVECVHEPSCPTSSSSQLSQSRQGTSPTSPGPEGRQLRVRVATACATRLQLRPRHDGHPHHHAAASRAH